MSRSHVTGSGRGVAARICGVLGLLVVVVLFVGCGSKQQSYSVEVRDSFMTACTEDDDDDPDLEDVCACTYGDLETKLPFDRFQAADKALASGGEDTPAEVRDIISDCIRRVSASRS